MAKKKAKRGGRREGSGRKQQFDQAAKFTVSLDQELLDRLDAWRAAYGWSRSEAIRWMIPQVIEHTTYDEAEGR